MGSLVIYGVPLVVYALVAGRRGGLSRREVARRLGLTFGERRYYRWALALALLGGMAAVEVGEYRSRVVGTRGEQCGLRARRYGLVGQFIVG